MTSAAPVHFRRRGGPRDRLHLKKRGRRINQYFARVLLTLQSVYASLEGKNRHTEVGMSQSGIAIRGEHRTAIQVDPEFLNAAEDLAEDDRLLEAVLYNGLLADTYNSLFAAMLARWRPRREPALGRRGLPASRALDLRFPADSRGWHGRERRVQHSQG